MTQRHKIQLFEDKKRGRGTGTCPKPKNQEFTKYTLNCSLMAA